MEIWDEVVKSALVGSERQMPDFAAGEGALQPLLARIAKTEPEAALLRASALLSGCRRAGYRPAALDREMPAPSDSDERLPVPAPLADDLMTMVRGEYREALPEWFEAAADRGWRAPEELLAELLDFGRSHSDYRAALLPLLGRRGRWLARQNPVWNYALQLSLLEMESPALDAEVGAPEETWQTGTKEERLALLQGLRRSSPATARTLVESTWAEDAPDLRAAFLMQFENGLSLEDEPLLEAALDDRRKEVRMAARDLLARLPEARFCVRMWTRREPLVRMRAGWTGRDSLAVEVPQECDKAMVRDGIEPKPPSGSRGPKAWWLFQIVRSIPLTMWTTEWKRTPEQIVTAAARLNDSEGGEWKQSLIDGWTAALMRSREREWAVPLFRFWIEAKTDGPSQAVPWAELLPADVLEEGILKLLERTRRQAQNGIDSHSLLAQHRAVWSPKFARAVLEHIRRGNNQYYYILSGVVEYAQRIPPEVRDEFFAAWPKLAENNPYFQGQLNRYLALEEFRTEMRRKFKAAMEN